MRKRPQIQALLPVEGRAAKSAALQASNAELAAEVEAGRAAIAGHLDRYKESTQASTAVLERKRHAESRS